MRTNFDSTFSGKQTKLASSVRIYVDVVRVYRTLAG